MLADQGPDLVGKNAVKSDSTKAELFPRPAELGLPVRAQGEQRPAAPDRVLPDVGERRPLAGGVDAEVSYQEATISAASVSASSPNVQPDPSCSRTGLVATRG